MDSSFRFPKIYKKYVDKGYFNIVEFSERDNFDGQYIWLYDMEWMTQSSILDFDYEEGQNKSVVPFAKSGGGDYWGWYSQESLDESPIVFCPSDDDEGFFYAPTFIAAIFRHIFEFASQNNFCVNECETWEMDLKLAQQHIKRWKEMFSNAMPKEWVSEIEKLQTRELFLYSETKASSYNVLITPEEADSIVKKYLKFDKYNQAFPWFLS